MTAGNTEKLINSLCDDLAPVKVTPHPLKRALPWISLAFFYMAIIVFSHGLRSDFSTKIHDFTYIFELLMVSFMSISAGFCALWLCIPDMRGQKWMIAVPCTAFACICGWIGLQIAMKPFSMPHDFWHVCVSSAIVFGAVPALTLLFLSITGKTTRPKILSFMLSLAIGGVGYIGLRLTCISDDIGHIAFYHTLPYIAFGLCAALLARKIYRW